MTNKVFAKVSNKDIAVEENKFKDKDPFRESWDTIKSYSGMNDPAAKRKITRKSDMLRQPTPQYIEDSKMQPGGNGSVSRQVNPGLEYLNGYGAFDVITPPYDLMQLAHYNDSNFVNGAAVLAKVMNVVGGGHAFEMSDKAKRKASESNSDSDNQFIVKKVARVKDSTEEWLKSLNQNESFDDTMTKVVTDLGATGNGYIEVGRTANGKVGYVGHIPSITMRVRRLNDGYVQIIGRQVAYFRKFGAANRDPLTGEENPNEIIHLKLYSPMNTYYGVPPIVSAIGSVIGDQLAEEYNIDYFKNKAVPRYVVTVRGASLDTESEERLFEFFRTNLKGQNHRTLYIPLESDKPDGQLPEFEMKAVENNIQESSFKGFRKENRDNILVAHQVPLTKLGGTDGATSAVAIAQDRTFRDQVCRPLQKKIENALEKLILEFTDIVVLKFKERNLVDEVQQAQMHQTYVSSGVMLKNEVRDKIGLPIIEGIDDEPVDAKAPSVIARESERAAQQSDGTASAQGRNPKGTGAKEDGNVS